MAEEIVTKTVSLRAWGVPFKVPVALSPEGSGVYVIRNSVSGKIYVGSAARKIRERWNAHKHDLRHNKHGNRFLQRAWNKYGERAFTFSVIVRCSPEWCITMEQIHINRLKSADRSVGYNLTPTAGSNLGVKHTPEMNAANSARQIGKKMSPECCASMSKSMRRRMGDPIQRDRIVSALALAHSDPDAVARANEGKRRYWKNPDPSHLAKLNAHRTSPETLLRLRTIAIGRKNSDAQKLATAEANRKRVFTPEMRLKMSLSAKKRCARPEWLGHARSIQALAVKSRLSKKNHG